MSAQPSIGSHASCRDLLVTPSTECLDQVLDLIQSHLDINTQTRSEYNGHAMKAGDQQVAQDGAGVKRLSPSSHSPVVPVASGSPALMETLASHATAVDEAPVAGGHTETVKFILNKRAPSGSHLSTSSHPLHEAVSQGNAAAVTELLASGCSVNTLSNSFESPLQVAVKKGHVDILQMLVQQGCDVNTAQPGTRVTALHLAVDQHQCPRLFKAILAELLQGRCDLDAVAYTTLETPLYRAVNFQKTALARQLLYHGANPNVSCPFDITLLQVACRQENVELVRALLNVGVKWKREAWLKFFFLLKGEVTTNSRINGLLQEWRLQPAPLVLLCRVQLRRVLGHNLPAKVACLPVPALSKKFILMEDLLN